MNPIKTLMGRRQFLIATGVTSTTALAINKLGNVIDPIFKSSIAEAKEKSGTEGKKETSNKYSHLLSPLKIGNVILKNRIMYSISEPHFIMGPESFPADTLRVYYANAARTAAIVTCRLGSEGLPRNQRTGDSAHIPIFDLSDPAVQNYIDQTVEGVHSMGSLVSGGGFGLAGASIKDVVAQAKQLEDKGFDLVTMGGDIRNKENARSTIERMQAIKGSTNLIILMSMMVIVPGTRPETEMSSVSNNLTLDEAIATAKMFEGSADILTFKASASMNSHPTGFNQEKGKPLTLLIAQAIKESGAKIILAPNGGFRDPELNDEFIATGKTDMISMARPMICDPEYGRKTYDGRGEDIVPCIMCNKCHGLSMNGPWFSVCSVNPRLGVESAIKVLEAPKISKKVAVIGGGPAGMKAALTAAERGHKVTLYEKEASLGGLLRHVDFAPFKWPLKDYKDYLIRQLKKTGVEVVLSTTATPEMIKAKGFDAVMAAVGAEPIIPRIAGVDGKNVWNVVNVYGKEKELGKNVAFIGGGEFGAETAIYLSEAGHNVTVLTSEKELVALNRVHYPEQIIDTYEHLDNFMIITNAVVSRISEGKVTYTDTKGNEKSMQVDSVVIYAGLRALQSESLKFSDSAGKSFYSVGDCTGKCGNVQKTTRSAYFMASQI